MAMTAEQKALQACADYARLSAEIKTHTATISRALSLCPGVEGRLLPVENVFDGIWHRHDAEDITHLKQAFTPDLQDAGWGGQVRVYMEDADVRDYLETECPHCLLAYESVMTRKAARKALGNAKRTISMIGRKALKVSA